MHPGRPDRAVGDAPAGAPQHWPARPAGPDHQAVIADVNRALSGLLTPLLPAACDLRFGRSPDDGPGIAFQLTEVVEDEQASGTEWTDVRDDSGRVTARRPPVRRFDLHYQVTVSGADADAEADLLDAVLIAADPGRRLSGELLPDGLAGHPVILRLGVVPAYAGTGRTAVRLIANAPLVLPLVTDVAAPAETIRLDVAAPTRPAPPSPTAQPSSSSQPSSSAQPGVPRRWRGAQIIEASAGTPVGGEGRTDAVRGENE